VVNDFLKNKKKERAAYKSKHHAKLSKRHTLEEQRDSERSQKTIKSLIDKENETPPDPNKCTNNKATRF
jgi:hypothetical protein